MAETAYRLIEERIVTLDLAPGTMTTEQQLCTELCLGRTPVREALLRLSLGHLVEIRARKGVLIRPVEIDYVLMTIDIRRMLERLIVTRAARYASDFERRRFLELAVMIEAAAAKPDVHGFMRIDDAFNRLMSRAARHEVAAKTVEPLHCVNRRIGFLYAGATGAGLRETGGEHARMMRAIADQQVGEAEAALDDLLEKAAWIAQQIGQFQSRELAS
ncbi:MAG TPA: GntR family transcriptional regulator [Alphaproteobacteria bacterium]|nr:GntR family transcriptional regulator [Alphaproteobacteria bacterium]